MPSELQLTRTPVAGRTALLCLPGTLCSPEVFEDFPAETFPSLQLLPVSWMTSPGPWDLSLLGQRVALLLQELELGPALLVGHSSGGPIALVAALTAPSLVKGLLLVDTGASTQGHGDIQRFLHALEAGPRTPTLEQLLKRSFFYPPDVGLIQRLLTYAANTPYEAAPEALRSQIQLDLTERLSEITVPVVILHGQHDQARPLSQAQIFAQQFPRAEFRVVDAGHTPMVEAPRAYEQALQRLCELVQL